MAEERTPREQELLRVPDVEGQEGIVGPETEPAVEVRDAVAESGMELTPDEQEAERRALAEAQEAAPTSNPEPIIPKDPVLVDIEGMLAKGLADIYQNLPAEKKQPFKEKGEQVAREIREMIVAGKVKARRVLELIREWLKLVPGINKFFLEQEAKIKTDGIVDYIEANIESRRNQL